MYKSKYGLFGLKRLDYLRRLLPAIAILISVELLSRFAFPAWNPSVICLLAVAITVLASGWRLGIGSAVLILAYSLYFFSTPGKLMRYKPDAIRDLLILNAAVLATVLITGWLRRRGSYGDSIVTSNNQLRREMASREQIGNGMVEGEEGLTDLCRQLSNEDVLARPVEQTEVALRQSYNLLRGIIEGTSDVVYVKDLQGRYLIINPPGAQQLGRSVEEMIGKDDYHFFTPETARQITELDRQVMEQGETMTGEMTIVLSGTAHTFQMTKSPYRDHNGEIIALIGVSHDITDRQRAAEHLENSRAQLRALSGRLQSVREEERRRIAREIHDELGQILTGLKMELASLTRRLSPPDSNTDWKQIGERTKSINQLIDDAIQTVRKISTELRPGLLDTVGLAATIEWYAEEFQARTGINCHLSSLSKKTALDQERSIAVFRIFQEILTNVARHAQATNVDVALEEEGNDLVMIAQDNGRGVNAGELSNPKSLGVLGMRERATLLGGELNIRGIQGKGTTVTLRVPLDK
jgi:PAS domain S-box-containing protein